MSHHIVHLTSNPAPFILSRELTLTNLLINEPLHPSPLRIHARSPFERQSPEKPRDRDDEPMPNQHDDLLRCRPIVRPRGEIHDRQNRPRESRDQGRVGNPATPVRRRRVDDARHEDDRDRRITDDRHLHEARRDCGQE